MRSYLDILSISNSAVEVHGIFKCPIVEIPALDAGYHPISLLFFHTLWNVLLPTRGNGTFNIRVTKRKNQMFWQHL